MQAARQSAGATLQWIPTGRRGGGGTHPMRQVAASRNTCAPESAHGRSIDQQSLEPIVHPGVNCVGGHNPSRNMADNGRGSPFLRRRIAVIRNTLVEVAVHDSKLEILLDELLVFGLEQRGRLMQALRVALEVSQRRHSSALTQGRDD
jgi:hypothetical protein